MSLYAAGNIAAAVGNLMGCGYAKFGGLIQNSRDVKDEDSKVREIAEELGKSPKTIDNAIQRVRRKVTKLLEM